MKIIILLGIIFIFGLIGYSYKLKLKYEYAFFNYIKEFNNFYQSNITLFKNNIVEIINKFIIMQKNKSADYNKLFIKNNNIYSINKEILSKYIIKENDFDMMFDYLNSLGVCEYSYEVDKINKFNNYISAKINNLKEDIKTKGDLYFKLLLAIGAVIAILLW